MRISLPLLILLTCVWITYPAIDAWSEENSNKEKTTQMQLGNFSVSLTVKDLAASKEFYEKLGFKVSGGDMERNYVVLQNATSTIGLYQGMFDKNMLTFNPGWDRDCQTLPEFQDIRDIQAELRQRGLEPVVAADESTTEPAFLTLIDPDGNPILIDQHVSKPATKESE